MTERAAILEATYHDLRFVKGRKQCQIVLEIPTERAQAFVSMFGTPDPANPAWVALARLNSPTQRTANQWNAMTPRAQMLARCKEPQFQTFIGCISERDALKKVESEFECSSRFPMPAEKLAAWQRLDSSYQEHIEAETAR